MAVFLLQKGVGNIGFVEENILYVTSDLRRFLCARSLR